MQTELANYPEIILLKPKEYYLIWKWRKYGICQSCDEASFLWNFVMNICYILSMMF